MDKYFLSTTICSEVFNEMFDNINSIEFSHFGERIQWKGKNIDQSIKLQDPFLYYLDQFFGNHGKLQLLKFPAHTYYKFHIDKYNKFNFNYTFEHYESLSLFRALPEDSDHDNLHDENFNIIKLSYEPNKWYLFNAQIPHAVINLDEKHRYVLTYTVSKESDISYETAVDIIKKFSLT